SVQQPRVAAGATGNRALQSPQQRLPSPCPQIPVPPGFLRPVGGGILVTPALPVSQPGLTLALPLAIIGCTLTHRQADTSSYVAECPAHPCSCPPGGLRTTAAHRPANRHSVATVANLLGALAGGRGGSVICQPADLYPGRIFHAGRRLCHQRFCRPGLGS